MGYGQVNERKGGLKLTKEEMAGATGPFGFWDTWGLTNEAQSSTLYLWREAELKHGRVTMLAQLGVYAAEKFHPLFGGDAVWESAYKSHHTELMSKYFWPGFL